MSERHIVPVILLLVSILYLGSLATRGWIPHDEGLLGQSAERLLLGEVPHRDFDDPYTGGSTALHALAFRVLGVRLESIRWTLLVCSLGFVAALYGIAARAARPWVAGVVTLVCVAWSLPNYFAGLPSWYVMFLVAVGIWCLLRSVDTGRRRWLLVAGVCGGLAVTVKIIGLYYVAAGLLFLAYRDATEAGEEDTDVRAPAFVGLIGVGALTLCVMVALLVGTLWGPETVHYVVPVMLLGAALVWNEHARGRGDVATRVKSLLLRGVVFLAGVIAPLTLFLVPFALAGALDDLYRGVFVLPRQRLTEATWPLPPIHMFLTTIPLLLVLALPRVAASRERFAWPLLGVALCIVIAFGSRDGVYSVVWQSARCLLPGLVVLAFWLLLDRGSVPVNPVRRQELFLLVAMTVMMSLVQFPYAFGVYFCYVTPLLVLLVLFLVQSRPDAPKRVMLCVAGFYLVFGVVWLNRGYVRGIGVRYVPSPPRVALSLDRAGLSVRDYDRQVYEAVVALVREHAEPGDFIYAAPDSPEVYFLSGTRNPTGTFYDFFDDPDERAKRIIDLVDRHAIKVVVINTRPEFSPPLEPEILAALRQRFPSLAEVGHFIVAWREE